MGEGGKTRTRRRELHPALRPDAAKQARAGVNNALRRGSAISGHVPVRDFLSSAYKACGRGRAGGVTGARQSTEPRRACHRQLYRDIVYPTRCNIPRVGGGRGRIFASLLTINDRNSYPSVG